MQTKNIRYFSYVLLFAIVGIAGVSMLFTSCEKDDDGDGGKIILNSYGPMPIARGAELRFIGKNLDKVTSVVLPENIEITSFGTRTSELLTITVPQNAVEGLIVLKTPQGDVTTKTPMGFSEPISISSFSPTTIKADSVLTITGDYLNLVKAVIFTDRVSVVDTAFISQSRYELKVPVPAAAQSGLIAVSNGAEDPIIVYSEDSLNVILPAITSISPNPVKAGTQLNITGSDLDLVEEIIFGGDRKLGDTAFTINGYTITVNVPENAQDGKLVLIPASGVRITSANELVMVIPTVSIATTTVKNGETMTVTGTNLDLIDKVIFNGEAEGTISTGGTETQIEVTIPDNAVSGTVKFVTLAAKEVTGPSLTLINPVFTSFSPASAKAKTDITINGNNLDVVKNVSFAGGVNGTISDLSTATQLIVTIPVGAKKGVITLIAKNGTEVKSSDTLTILANLPVISGYSESRGEPGKVLTINGTNLLLIKQLVFPGNIVATDYGLKSDTKVEVYVPTNVTFGDGTASMVTYEGEEGLLPEIFFGGLDPIKTGAHIIVNYDDKNNMWGGGGFQNGQTTNPAGISGSGNYARWTIDGATDGWNDPSNCGTWAGDANGLTGNPADFVLKIDFFANKPFSKTTSIEFTIGGKASRIYPPCDMEQASGWITITVPMTQFDITSMSGLGDIAMNVRAPSSTPVDLEYCLDNIRIESK